MRGEHIFTFGTVYGRCTDEVTVHSHHIQMAFDVVGHLKAVRECRRLVATLGHADAHVEVTKAAWGPKTVVIAIVGVVGIVGLQSDVFSINGSMYIGEFDDFGMLDIGRNHNHHGV